MFEGWFEWASTYWKRLTSQIRLRPVAQFWVPWRRFAVFGLGLYHQRPDVNGWLFSLARLLPKKCLRIHLFPFHGPPDVGWFAPLLAGFGVVLPINCDDLIDPLNQFRVLHRDADLHPTEEISGRPVRAREIDFRFASVFETINPAVL